LDSNRSAEKRTALPKEMDSRLGRGRSIFSKSIRERGGGPPKFSSLERILEGKERSPIRGGDGINESIRKQGTPEYKGGGVVVF